MEKDKFPSSHGHGLPPPASSPSSRYAPFASPSSSSFPLKPELSPSPSPSPSSSQQQSSNFGQDSGRFSHDISRMPDFPTRNVGHRRAHSEILSLPDDISFDSDLGVVGCGGDGPSLSDEADEDLFSMYMDMEKFSSSASSGSPMPEGSGAAPSTTPPSMPPVTGGENSVSVSNNDRPRVRHQHSQSMDGSTLIKSELLTSGSEGPSQVETKKAISAAKLADLALVDPKRAKRIWANRQSAARSKERKMRYISELERKVQTLQTEATTLSSQLTMLQRDTTGLNAENSELKLRLQTMEQQVHLQDALNDALREEVQRLKLMTGQVIPNGAPLMNYGPSSYGASQQFYPQNHAMQSILAAHQLQQLHIHSQQQQQQQMHPNQIPHQHQHQQQPAELRSKTPMTLSNQSQRDSSSDDSKLANKE